MDIELKQKWVGALRSGEFKQATGDLKRDGCYCCLGVLCAIAGAEWTDFENPEPDFEGIGRTQKYRGVPVLDGECLSSGEDGELGEVGLHKFGLDAPTQKTLVEMNDGWEKTPQHSFAQIADYIEKNL